LWRLPDSTHDHGKDGDNTQNVVRVHVCQEDAGYVDHAQGRLVEPVIRAVGCVEHWH
jgi:hypothetical protein